MLALLVWHICILCVYIAILLGLSFGLLLTLTRQALWLVVNLTMSPFRRESTGTVSKRLFFSLSVCRALLGLSLCVFVTVGHQVRDDWQSRELELVSYQGRIQLVKGWDAVFSRLEEHLNGLQSMRASPHFHAVQVMLNKNIKNMNRLLFFRAAVPGGGLGWRCTFLG